MQFPSNDAESSTCVVKESPPYPVSRSISPIYQQQRIRSALQFGIPQPSSLTSIGNTSNNTSFAQPHRAVCRRVSVGVPIELPSETPIPYPTLANCAYEFLPMILFLSVALCGAICAMEIGSGYNHRWCVWTFEVLASALLVASYVLSVYKLHALLRVLASKPTADHTPATFCGFEPSNEILHFLQHFSSRGPRLSLTPPEPRNPLQCLDHECLKWSLLPDGYIVIDSTGVILWSNEATQGYFGYTEGELYGQNVRILMPESYARQHDHFLRRYQRHGRCNVIGTKRAVPVITKTAQQRIVVLSVTEVLDSVDNNKLYVGCLEFCNQDPLLQAFRTDLEEERVPFEKACLPLEEIKEAILVMTSKGIIEFVNTACYQLFNWPAGSLLGSNVKLLMGDNLASRHDDFLQLYAERCEKEGKDAVSSIVSSGRDVMAKTRDGREVRIFLSVYRIDQPRQPSQGFRLVGKMVAVGGRMPSRVSTGSTVLGHHKRASSSRSLPNTLHGPQLVLRRVRCTVLVLDVYGLSSCDLCQVRCLWSSVLLLACRSAQKYKGIVHPVIGNRLVITFNAGDLVNSSHRSSAAAVMTELQALRGHQNLSHDETLRFQMAAVSQDCFVGAFEAHCAIFGEAFETASALLHIGRAMQVTHGIIDNVLHDELHYSYTCRPLNYVTFHPRTQRATTVPVYELLALKEVCEDEWMYQISAHNPQEDGLKHWRDCWKILSLPMDQTKCGQAAECLKSHLLENSDDTPALYLTASLPEATAPQHILFAGTLSYTVHFLLPQTTHSDTHR